MKHFFYIGISLLALAEACVKTEIVPETLTPKLSITVPSNPVITRGDNLQLMAVYTDEQGRDRSNEIQWGSQNPAFATVGATGLVTANASGQVWIVAAAASVRDSVLLSVVEDLNNPAKVQISAVATNLLPGDTLQLQAQVLNGNNTPLSGYPITWSSSDPAVATVDANGLLRSISEGTTLIRASGANLVSPPLSVVVSSSQQERTGVFSGNSGYSVEGTATLVKTGQDIKLVFGSDFKSSNGPMLAVYLAQNPSGSLNTSNSLKIGDLSSNTGMQEYAVPGNITLTTYNHVVVYCVPFNVRFGTATLN